MISNIRTCYYFDEIIKIKDFDFDNVLINERLRKNILVYNMSYKTLIGEKPVRIRFAKVNGFISVYDGTRYLVLLLILLLLEMKNMNLFTTGLDIL